MYAIVNESFGPSLKTEVFIILRLENKCTSLSRVSDEHLVGWVWAMCRGGVEIATTGRCRQRSATATLCSAAAASTRRTSDDWRWASRARRSGEGRRGRDTPAHYTTTRRQHLRPTSEQRQNNILNRYVWWWRSWLPRGCRHWEWWRFRFSRPWNYINTKLQTISYCNHFLLQIIFNSPSLCASTLKNRDEKSLILKCNDSIFQQIQLLATWYRQTVLFLCK